MTDVSNGAGTAYPSGAPDHGFIPNFQWSSCYFIFSFLCSYFADHCPFLFWPLCCLSFDLLLLITPMVSSKFSYTNDDKYVPVYIA